MRGWLFAIGALQLAGCGSPQPSVSIDQSKPLEWKSAPDNSHFARARSGPEGLETDTALRCWDVGKSYRCLVAEARMGFLKVWVGTAPLLPEDILAIPREPEAGYGCSSTPTVGKSIDEEVVSPKGKIASHMIVGLGDGPWSAAYVNRLVDEQKIEGAQRHFDCVSIIRVIRDGSMETLGSSVISRHLI